MNAIQLDEEAVFHVGRRIPDGEARQAYLDQVCGGNRGLRDRVNALLHVYEQERSFLESTPVEPGAAPTVDLPRLVEGPGTVIGPYKLLEQIGEGGMGVVYMAEQTHPVRRKVALKIIKPGMDTKQVIARFEAERQALAMMDHHHIARVLDAGATESGRPYFVMELVKGIPITDYCDRNRLAIEDRLELFVQACQAVQHAHQKGIIHRDLKPSNVLVTMIDGAAVPKVIDFGVAKAMGQQLTEKTLFTGFAQLIGTPLYMSPEQAEFSGVDVDTRSDIYALGVLLYELLTGTTPFNAETFRTAAYDEIRRIIREVEPLRPSTRISTLEATAATVSANRKSDPRTLGRVMRGELDWIVMRCLEKDRTRRYETASGLAADVRNYLGGEPVRACPPSARYRFAKFARRHRVALATSAVVAMALVLGTAVSTWQAVRATRAERAALRAEATIRRERDRAVKAEGQATESARKAQTEAAVSKAINDFLLNDLLAEAAPEKNARVRQVTVEEVLNKASTRIAGKFDGQPEIEAAIRLTIGDTYLALGLYSKAQPNLERALELGQRVLGPEKPQTLEAMSSLAVSYMYQSQYDKAEPLLTQELELRRRVLGPEDRGTLTAMANLAALYDSRRQYEKAERFYTQALDLQRRVLGPEDPLVLNTMHNLGVMYHRRGQYEKAESQLTQAMETGRRIRGPQDPETLKTMSELASLYHDYPGRFDEAESLFKQALEAQRRVFGPEHPVTLSSVLGLLQVTCGKNIISNDDSLRAVEMGRWLVKQEANNGGFWKWLAVAEYRACNWDRAIQATQKCNELRGDQGYVFQFLILALAHARRGEMDRARAWYSPFAYQMYRKRPIIS